MISLNEFKNDTKSLEEKTEQKQIQEKYNSVTQKTKVENQNQTHNAKKEGINPINQRR